MPRLVPTIVAAAIAKAIPDRKLSASIRIVTMWAALITLLGSARLMALRPPPMLAPQLRVSPIIAGKPILNSRLIV